MIPHQEPDRDGDFVDGLKVALVAEAIVVVAIFVAIIVNSHSIARYVETALASF